VDLFGDCLLCSFVIDLDLDFILLMIGSWIDSLISLLFKTRLQCIQYLIQTCGVSFKHDSLVKFYNPILLNITFVHPIVLFLTTWLYNIFEQYNSWWRDSSILIVQFLTTWILYIQQYNSRGHDSSIANSTIPDDMILLYPTIQFLTVWLLYNQQYYEQLHCLQLHNVCCH